MTMSTDTPDSTLPVPGQFDHKALSCSRCECITPHRRPSKSTLGWQCVRCVERAELKAESLVSDLRTFSLEGRTVTLQPPSEEEAEAIAEDIKRAERFGERIAEFKPQPPDDGRFVAPPPVDEDYLALSGAVQLQQQKDLRLSREQAREQIVVSSTQLVRSVLQYIESFK